MVKNDSINEIGTRDALLTLAYMGDLSMGQPADHSLRVAWLARRMAQHIGLDDASGVDIAQIALLRWVGCTANAPEVANIISDDVQGRAAMLALRPSAIQLLIEPHQVVIRSNEVRAIHCEVSLIIGEALQLRPTVLRALQSLFESWDGTGYPLGLRGDEIPLAVYLVLLAGDLEVFQREYGLTTALQLLTQRGNQMYSQQLVDEVVPYAAAWLAELDAQGELSATALGSGTDEQTLSLNVVADTIGLKLPWLAGHSRAVAHLAGYLAQRLNLPPALHALIHRAALLHGLGRVTVPNATWNKPSALASSEWERVRLVPYWTARAGAQIKALAQEAEIASFSYERLDGSGYFRAAQQAATGLEQRILPVATTWLALNAERPWRRSLSSNAAIALMQQQVVEQRLDAAVVEALMDWVSGAREAKCPPAPIVGNLSMREAEVLRCISRGLNNKAAARQLDVSPSTVRTHMESIFRKLGCNSRAAATLKASTLGLL